MTPADAMIHYAAELARLYSKIADGQIARPAKVPIWRAYQLELVRVGDRVRRISEAMALRAGTGESVEGEVIELDLYQDGSRGIVVRVQDHSLAFGDRVTVRKVPNV